jgi:RNAse (barnase) inhibitor barstar
MKRELYFNGSNILDPKDFHTQFATLLGFPSYYSGDLDDLWTCLTSYIDPQVRLTIHDFDNLIKVFGPEAEGLKEVFNRLPEAVPEMELLIN